MRLYESDEGSCITNLYPGDVITNGRRDGEVIEVTPSPFVGETDLYVYVGSLDGHSWADYWLLEDVRYEVRQ